MSSSVSCDIQDQSQRQMAHWTRISQESSYHNLMDAALKKTSPFPPSGNSGRWKGVYYSKKEGTDLTCCH